MTTLLAVRLILICIAFVSFASNTRYTHEAALLCCVLYLVTVMLYCAVLLFAAQKYCTVLSELKWTSQFSCSRLQFSNDCSNFQENLILIHCIHKFSSMSSV
jgi:hypothetical protein